MRLWIVTCILIYVNLCIIGYTVSWISIGKHVSAKLCQNEARLSIITKLGAKKMTFLTEGDEDEIAKMISSRNNQARMMVTQKMQLAAAKTASQSSFTKDAPSPQETAVSPKVDDIELNDQPKRLLAPNENWRQALKSPYRPMMKQTSVVEKKAPAKYLSDDFDLDDLDYDDFEQAMREEEFEKKFGMGTFVPTSKVSVAVEDERDVMHVGELVPFEVFEKLQDFNGTAYSIAKVHQKISDIVVAYVDPRRFTDDYKEMINELDRLPKTSLKVALMAVNFDSVGDIKKARKKFVPTFPVLVDPSRSFADALKCKEAGRISSCLVMLEANSGMILNIWYEGDWNTFMVKDMLTDEIKKYRVNPVRYVKDQLGL